MSAEWWGADVIPRVRWRLRVPRQSINEGDDLPDGWGVAYYDPCIDAAVCMPLPLNVIVGAWRAFIWWLKCPPWRLVERRADRMRRRVEKARSDAYHDARRRFERETALLRAHNEALIKTIVEAGLTAPRTIWMSKEVFDQVTKP